MTISFGRCGAGSTAGDRKAVAVDALARDGEIGMVVADDALFDKRKLFGRLVSRDEALGDSALADLGRLPMPSSRTAQSVAPRRAGSRADGCPSASWRRTPSGSRLPSGS